MKVLDLACGDQHVFEGWFASEDDFQSQLTRGLVECPMCGRKDILKRLSAPRLNLGASAPEAPFDRPQPSAGQGVAMPTSADQKNLQAAWLQMARQMLAHTEDVGERFADEARKIHYGEAEDRGIRGQATPAQTAELLEEGIPVLPLPLPPGLKGPTH